LGLSLGRGGAGQRRQHQSDRRQAEAHGKGFQSVAVKLASNLPASAGSALSVET
jgi:hypothetical protein